MNSYFGGDRNFITSPEHRVSSSATGGWHPGRETIQAWSVVMDAMGLGAVVEQCDFTWQRIARSRTGENSFCRKILDVVGASIDYARNLHAAAHAMVVHTLPFPNASDHKPIALAFTDILTQRPKREAGARESLCTRMAVPRTCLRRGIGKRLRSLERWSCAWASRNRTVQRLSGRYGGGVSCNPENFSEHSPTEV